MARPALRPVATDDDPGYVLPDDDFTTLKLRQMRADVRRAEITLEEREGKLISRESALRTIEAIGANVAQRAAGLPDRFANEFGADDVQRRRMRDRLREELAQLLRSFANTGDLER